MAIACTASTELHAASHRHVVRDRAIFHDAKETFAAFRTMPPRLHPNLVDPAVGAFLAAIGDRLASTSLLLAKRSLVSPDFWI
jgi:hypothetical protein